MIEIRIENHEERLEDLLNLFQSSYQLKASSELWKWKYLQNPLASAHPEVVVAIDNNKIVGARPLLLSELWLGNQRVKAAQPCDTMVHSEYRREGLFSKMNKLAIEFYRNNSYALFYNFPNGMSRPGYLKQGWKMTAITENLCRFNNPQKLLAHKLKNRPAGYLAGSLYDRFLNHRVQSNSLSGNFHSEVFNQYPFMLQEVAVLRDKATISIARDETYFKWRFDRHPENKYEYIVVKKGEALWGYAVISRQEQNNGLVHGIIMDYLVKNNDIECFRVLMNACLNELEKFKCDLIFVWAFSEIQFRQELMKNFGFKSPLKFPYGKLLGTGYFLVREINSELLGGMDIFNGSNWRVTHYYHDIT